MVFHKGRGSPAGSPREVDGQSGCYRRLSRHPRGQALLAVADRIDGRTADMTGAAVEDRTSRKCATAT